jgi:hypothetical protein
MPVSRWTLISLVSWLGAVGLLLLGRTVGSQMIASGQGFEMAFYWSPHVYLEVRVLLAFAAVAGLFGVVVGRTNRCT